MTASIVLALAWTLASPLGSASAAPGLRVIAPVRVFSGVPGDPVRDGMAVLIRGDRIALVAPLERVVVPAGAELIDGAGGTLLPGLVDMHVHLAGSGSRFDRPFAGSPTLHQSQALACGVTCLLDLNAPDDLIALLRRPGGNGLAAPLVYTSLAAITCPGGHGTEGGFPARVLTTNSDASAIVDGLAAGGADFVKVMYDGGGWAGHPARPMLSEQALRSIVRAAAERGLRVIVHAVTTDAMLSALAAGAAAIAHAPVAGEVDDRLIAAFLENDAALISTLVAYEAPFRADGDRYLLDPLAQAYAAPQVLAGFSDPEFSDWVARNPAHALRTRFGSILTATGKLHAAGVRVLAGTDAGTPGAWHGVALHRELELLVRAGMTPAAALLSATSKSAEFLRRDDIGVVEVGRRADLVLVDGRPDEQISATRSIRFVMLGGELVDRAAVQAQTKESETTSGGADDVVVLLDFEDPGRGNAGSISTSNSESHASAVRTADLHRDNPGSFLRMRGEVVPSPPSGGFARLEVSVAPPGLDGWRGIRFRARATPRTRVRVQVGTRAVQDGDDFGVELPFEDTWREYRLPFEAFTQVGFGKRVRFRPSEILTISWMTGVGVEGPFQIDLDDAGWYR